MEKFPHGQRHSAPFYVIGEPDTYPYPTDLAPYELGFNWHTYNGNPSAPPFSYSPNLSVPRTTGADPHAGKPQ